MSINNVNKIRLKWILTLIILAFLFIFIDRYLNKIAFPANDYETFCRDKLTLYSYCKDKTHIRDISKALTNANCFWKKKLHVRQYDFI